MKLSNSILIIFVVCASSVLGVPMDMEMPEQTNTASSKEDIDYSSLVPVAHEMKHQHGVPILELDSLTPAERLYWESYNTTTYFTMTQGDRSALYYHAFTIAMVFVVLYPIALVLNNVSSNWFIPFLTFYNLVLVSSLFSLGLFSSSVSDFDLYTHNAYRPMSYILLVLSLTHYVSAVLLKAFKWINQDYSSLDDYPVMNDDSNFIPLDDIDLERASSQSPTLYEPSTSFKISTDASRHKVKFDNFTMTAGDNHTYKDSLDLNDPNNSLSSSNSPPQRSSDELPTARTFSHQTLDENTLLYKVFSNKTVQAVATKFHLLTSIVFNVLNYPMFGYLFIYIVTGIVVGNLLGKANHVFNLLAHFIKGGVFVMIGLLSLARYCGCLQKNGLAWNKAIVFKNQISSKGWWFRYYPHGMITMEGYESFLIFFYGSTNVFLEHLASPGGAWSAKDLQHVSIAFMYIGSGLCGLITEYILSEWRFNQVLRNTRINPSAIHAGSPGYSPNPFPVFTIFWTGILMSSHEQASKVSTMIHVQWGYLLAYGSFFRLLTFLLLMLVPNKNLNPARPFTELITSFCLIAGGAIFMQSNDEVVQALEYRGLTSMFTLNVNVGIVAIIMGWEMLLLIWKLRLQKSNQI
ncbi:hypothetical protein WICPIJ_006117 [Wickerhamomyces pijperi]|uniref:Protein YTP1-like C-terminal domain-containing protein n=1 Tax=Wickerhamomyces pijperi TaxID=599730 RepID=A0A9P8Q4M1_WICPI|nr:hypothetical protein WICPIJ_006117 [Wickerhamomyces pijperi]